MMDWISVKDRLPDKEECIVGIMQGRQEQTGDPILSADIVQLRVCTGRIMGLYSMDNTDIYYLPGQEGDYYSTLAYWIPFDDFIWPKEMKITD